MCACANLCYLSRTQTTLTTFLFITISTSSCGKGACSLAAPCTHLHFIVLIMCLMFIVWMARPCPWQSSKHAVRREEGGREVVWSGQERAAVVKGRDGGEDVEKNRVGHGEMESADVRLRTEGVLQSFGKALHCDLRSFTRRLVRLWRNAAIKSSDTSSSFSRDDS